MSSSEETQNVIPPELVEAATNAKPGRKRASPSKSVTNSQKRKSEGDVEEVVPEKRAIRLEKNREAAHQFRQRQKAYLLELESKVSSLTTENAENKAKVELLRSENQLIREQLNYLRAFITQAVSFSLPFQNNTGGAAPTLPPLPPGLTLPPGLPVLPPNFNISQLNNLPGFSANFLQEYRHRRNSNSSNKKTRKRSLRLYRQG
ncbi:hypothetical protein PROFUN_06600 [Planoprotostelium fungivorum]|uniref:BZIP domain-containing protein n=1 Tax=Planoprotostelium fungivorum TaxID=1890364 RepID=A0A2P6MRY9_9EUKA|nr:hypothetical protein PROFUN_06600 [Planoprotostelium fungivorum]